MIENLAISSLRSVIDDRLHKYIIKKIGGLDKFIPRAARASVAGEVRIKQVKQDGGRQFECDISLALPEEIIHVSEIMPNAFSAIDVVEAKLKHQIERYKEQHAGRRA